MVNKRHAVVPATAVIPSNDWRVSSDVVVVDTHMDENVSRLF